MQIEKVMSLLEVLSSWLEDNINMDSEIIFDNDEDNTNSEILYPAVEKANAVLRKMASLSSDSVHAIRQRLQLAVEGKAELSLKDVGELLLATKYLMLSTEEESKPVTTLVFEMADINKLIEEIRTAKTFSVTADQIYDPACYPGEPSLTLRDRLQKRRVKLVGFSFPHPQKLPAHIWCQKCFSRTVMVYT